jgi:hypothetical protein
MKDVWAPHLQPTKPSGVEGSVNERCVTGYTADTPQIFLMEGKASDVDLNDLNDDEDYVEEEEEEEEESNHGDDQSDDTISKLNDEDHYREDHIDDEYEDVIQRIQLEEERLMNDLHQNQPPDKVKKGRCDLNIDQRCLRFFKDQSNSSNFEIYLGQRRESKQAIEGVLIHASQFASYAKLKVPALKTITTAKELLETISQNHPLICHQHFDFLQQIHNLKASTIISRIDSVTLLYEWMRLNSNDIHIFRDVSLCLFLFAIFFPLTITLDE